MNDYYINIFYSAEDEGYIADIRDLEPCSAFGDTPQEALEEVRTFALTPPPSPQPELKEGESYKFAMRENEREAKVLEVLVAKEGWLETAKENGLPIPEPRYRPAIYQAHPSQIIHKSA